MGRRIFEENDLDEIVENTKSRELGNLTTRNLNYIEEHNKDEF